MCVCVYIIAHIHEFRLDLSLLPAVPPVPAVPPMPAAWQPPARQLATMIYRKIS